MTSTKMSDARQFFLGKAHETLGEHQTLMVVGLYWGDEGKGKLVSALMPDYLWCARYMGGANAGHTSYNSKGEMVVTHQEPTGLEEGKFGVLLPGVFFDDDAWLEERKSSKSEGVTFIDSKCTLALPYHRVLEAYIERCKGRGRTGTTGRGIASHLIFDRARIGLRVGDMLLSENEIFELLQPIHRLMRPIYAYFQIHETVDRAKRLFGAKTSIHSVRPPDVRALAKKLHARGQELQSVICDTTKVIDLAYKAGDKIQVESSQAAGLGGVHGTYPYVTAGDPTPPLAAAMAGMPGKFLDVVIGLAKLFPSRVGAGDFVTELWDRDLAEKFGSDPIFKADHGTKSDYLKLYLGAYKIAQKDDRNKFLARYLQVLGDERGATTGRGRSVGYPDLHWLSYSVRITKPDLLAFMKIDVADALPEIPVCVGYRYKGSRLGKGEMPFNMRELKHVTPEIQMWSGWEKCTRDVRDWDQLPKNAKVFFQKTEDFLQVPIGFLGVGELEDQIVARGAEVFKIRERFDRHDTATAREDFEEYVASLVHQQQY